MGCSSSSPDAVSDRAETYKEKPSKAKAPEEAPLVSSGDVNTLYTFGKELGQGAYSVVYKATEKVAQPSAVPLNAFFSLTLGYAFQSSKKTVAIKKIRKSSLQPHDHAALKEEASVRSGVPDIYLFPLTHPPRFPPTLCPGEMSQAM